MFALLLGISSQSMADECAGAGKIRQAGAANRFAYAPAIAAGAMAALVLP